MRDVQRIDEILQTLKYYWEDRPDLRLGQIISNCARKKNMDPYYLEDEDFLNTLNEYIERDKVIIPM